MAINWDALGALAEGLGAIAVIMSVLYLATQIRSQTKEARLSATRELAIETSRLLQAIALDREFSEIYQAGLYDYKNLPDNDRMRVSYMFQVYLNLNEQQYFHTQHGSIDEAYLESSERSFKQFFSISGVQEYWHLSKDAYGEGYVSYVDNLIAEAQSIKYTNTFNRESSDSSKPANT
ncbi:MAG: hypothetical protein DRR06_15620 [Gammaproteobacteria bacterium]|nr:MAG: hypothetical protein DRR06_15620 [Gammaproteobacteria bacterium]RLA49971.1 MAG: hypothetical protein DRR42_14370 [Gammaproteobacteria bacterium]